LICSNKNEQRRRNKIKRRKRKRRKGKVEGGGTFRKVVHDWVRHRDIRNLWKEGREREGDQDERRWEGEVERGQSTVLRKGREKNTGRGSRRETTANETNTDGSREEPTTSGVPSELELAVASD
jgi:hypothetical protein